MNIYSTDLIQPWRNRKASLNEEVTLKELSKLKMRTSDLLQTLSLNPQEEPKYWVVITMPHIRGTNVDAAEAVQLR